MTVGEILDMSLKILKLTCLNLFLHHTHTHTHIHTHTHTHTLFLFSKHTHPKEYFFSQSRDIPMYQ